MGCHFFLQGIFPIQGLNTHLLHLQHWWENSLPLRHLRSPVQIGRLCQTINTMHSLTSVRGFYLAFRGCFQLLLLSPKYDLRGWSVVWVSAEGDLTNRMWDVGRSQMLPRWLSGKESACQCRRCKRCRFNPWVGKIPWRKKWHPTPVFLPGKFYGQRSLTVYSPWDRGELDTEVT